MSFIAAFQNIGLCTNEVLRERAHHDITYRLRTWGHGGIPEFVPSDDSDSRIYIYDSASIDSDDDTSGAVHFVNCSETQANHVQKHRATLSHQRTHIGSHLRHYILQFSTYNEDNDTWINDGEPIELESFPIPSPTGLFLGTGVTVVVWSGNNCNEMNNSS